MMKFVLAALAVLALSSPLEAFKIPRSGNGALADEIQPFVDVLPIDKMLSIFLEYSATDAQFQKVLAYVKSDDFKNLLSFIDHDVEARHLIEYVQTAGIDAHAVLNAVHKYFGLPPYTTLGLMGIKGGVRGFLDEEEAIIPVDKLTALYNQKLNSKVFADLMVEVKKPEVQQMADRLFADKYFQDMLARAKKVGIKVEDILEFLEKFLGLHFH